MNSRQGFLVSCLILSCSLAGCGSNPVPVEQYNHGKDGTTVLKPADGPKSGEKKPVKAKTVRPSLEVAEEFRLEQAPSVWLTAEELEQGWFQLFDGQTLFGWHANNDVDWHVNEAGEIQAEAGETGLLLTTVPYADFEFRCQYWISEGGNSGVFFRTMADPKEVTADCYEFNICDSHEKFRTGSLVGRSQPSTEASGEGTWKAVHVTFDGKRFTAKIDGEEVIDYEDTSDGFRAQGLIGLQKNSGQIRFKDVALRPLNVQSITHGDELEGWHVVPGSKAKFSRVDGEINVQGGPGFLESDASWGNFLLQMEGRTNLAGLNGGLFFRLIPGTEKAPSNGYEMQIEHVFLEGDRRRPKDNAGTGGIFRRTQARWVMPNDEENFHATLIAYGPRIATWVNGIQMSDWEDTRPVNENPRRGLRTEPGPVSLQGHDSSTDVSFGYLRVFDYGQTE